MILLNAKYKCSDRFEKDDFNAFVFDWVTNTNDLRYHMDLEEHTGEYTVYEYQKKKLTFVDYADAGVMAAYHTNTDREGVEWRLSAVFRFLSHELFLQLSNSETTESGRFLRKFRKPDLIDELVDLKVIEKDGSIDVSYHSHDIDLSNIEEIEEVIEGRAANTLPVIFLSTTPYGYYALDPEDLADRYAGMAHVFAQRDDELTYVLKERHPATCVPYGGAIVIYFPVRSLQPNLTPFGRYDEKQTLNRISKGLNFYFKSQNFGRMTTFDEISSTVLSSRNKSLKSQNEQIIEENQKISEENKSIVETFDTDLKKTDEENERLKRRITDLETENRILKQRLEQTDGLPLLVYGEEEEIYPNEIKELLFDILENLDLKEGSRRKDIVEDILAANSFNSSLDDRRTELKSILLNYRGLNQDQIKRLERLGFTVTSDGKHHKLVYHNDGRYAISISKTSSDVKAGKNVVALIIRNMM